MAFTIDILIAEQSATIQKDWKRIAPTWDNTIEPVVEQGTIQKDWKRIASPISWVAELEFEDAYAGTSQPFIDTLNPVIVGSDWRNAAMDAAKVKLTDNLPELDPPDGGSDSQTASILIPCGDRIPEFGDILIWVKNDPGYTLPSQFPGLDNAKTIIIANGTLVYRNETSLNSWTVTSTANDINGFDYEIAGPGGTLPVGVLTFSIYLEGVESFLDTYTFLVVSSIPPILINKSPASGDTRVSRNILIQFDAYDTDDRVEFIDAYINGSLVLEFDGITASFVSPYDGPSSAVTSTTIDSYDGYHVILDNTNEFSAYETIGLRAIAEDIGGQIVDEYHTFRVEDYEPPTLTIITPTSDQTGVYKQTLVKFDVTQDKSGVDQYSINAYINDAYAFEGYNFVAPFDGTSSQRSIITDGYRITIDNSSDFGSGSSVTVKVYAKNNEGV
jgi:hypothetical protein